MNLLVKMLVIAISELMAAKKIDCRVETKLNRNGEIVIGVILAKGQPAGHVL